MDTAKAIAKDLSISTKHSIEVCNFIRGKNLQEGKDILKKVIEKERAVPFRRFNRDLGHKKGIGPGRYPINVCKDIIKVLDLAEANAQYKGLDIKNLIIKSIKADKASTPWHSGRQRRRKMKRTHIEVIVEEKEAKTDKK